jgi:hypothetical protein
VDQPDANSIKSRYPEQTSKYKENVERAIKKQLIKIQLIIKKFCLKAMPHGIAL